MEGDGHGYDPLVGAEPRSDEPDDAGDPFEGVDLDEAFVQAAPIREPTAADRARAAREAELSRLLSEDASRAARDAPGDWEGWPSDPWEEDGTGRTRQRRRRTLRVLAVLILVAMVFVYVVADLVRPASSGSRREDGAATVQRDAGARGTELEGAGATEPGGATLPETWQAPADQDLAAVRPEDWPPAPLQLSDRPLGVPAPVPEGGGPHTFALHQADGVTPVGWDPCRPITYVTRPGTLAAAERLVEQAVEMVSTATGLQFMDQGRTDEAPSEDRSSYQPERYGERWAPVLIAWSDARESPRLGRSLQDDPGADVAGYASTRSAGYSTTDPETGRSVAAGSVLVSGSVVLDEEDLARMLEEPDGWARARAVVAHELGHLVGLGHVDDPAQLMHPRARPSVTGFAPGDLEGLARLGTLECYPGI